MLRGVDQGAFEMPPVQRAKPNSNVVTITSTQVNGSDFCGIMLLPFDGRLRADAPKRENGSLPSRRGDVGLKSFSMVTCNLVAQPRMHPPAPSFRLGNTKSEYGACGDQRGDWQYNHGYQTQIAVEFRRVGERGHPRQQAQ